MEVESMETPCYNYSTIDIESDVKSKLKKSKKYEDENFKILDAK